MHAAIVAAAIAAVAVVLAVAVGAYRWQAGTVRLRESFERVREHPATVRVNLAEVEQLPPPVQRFFRNVLYDGQRLITAVHIRHSGMFNMGEKNDRWKPFTSEQRVITRPPAFDWNARIAMLPGLPVRVHDAYIAGEGILQASLLGLVTLADLRDGGALAEGELLRFLAEAAWYPTALLPGQGVRWEAVDERSARGTLTDGPVRAAMLFTFDEQGNLASVSAARGRTVSGKVISTPWQGRFWNYQSCEGMQVPMDGEVAWMLPEGEKPYWRGSVSGISYEFAAVGQPGQ